MIAAVSRTESRRVLLIYKLAPPLRLRYELVLSAALVALGVAYVMMA